MLNRITVTVPNHNDLLFWKLEGRESLSQPFQYRLTLLSENARINRASLLGQSVTVNIPAQLNAPARHINGVVTRAGVSPAELDGQRYSAYTLTLEPALWALMRDKNMRIFQEQTVPEIVRTVLREQDIALEMRLHSRYRTWGYCVQYQESSLDFISRLMEHEGITYHFRHEPGSHILVLTDCASAYTTLPGYENIPWHASPRAGATEQAGITHLAQEDCITPGLCSLEDYDFRKPNAWLLQARQNPASPTPGEVDVYEWPARFTEHAEGEAYARVRQERWQVEHQQIEGESSSLGIAPGHLFTLNGSPDPEHNQQYLTTGATYALEENPYTSSGGSSTQRVNFSVIPASKTFRPAQSTCWPKTHGPQTAKVVGPAGESIWTDKYGRVKVKFHWDRQSGGDDRSSCWIRVSSAWAGQGFGGVQIPRVGDEVVVDFINGDPDRPIITGRVYNDASMPPWELPAAASQMGFMTHSVNGTMDNSSYLLFNDTGGSELVALHAEKELSITVEGDSTELIDGNQTIAIGQNLTEVVRGDVLYDVKGDRTLHVKGADNEFYDGSVYTRIQGGHIYNIDDGGEASTIKGGRITTIEGDEDFTVTQNTTQTYSTGKTVNVLGGGVTETITGDVKKTISGGSWTVEVLDGKVMIYSPNEITIKSDTNVNIDVPYMKANAHAHSESFTGNSLSITGASESITGISSNFTGKYFAVTPLSKSYVGTSASITGIAVSFTGLNVGYTAFQHVNKPMEVKDLVYKVQNGGMRVKNFMMHMLN